MSTDGEFGGSVYVLAQAMRRIGQPVYFYFFTYPAKSPPNLVGKAYHGFELMFLGDIYPWETDEADRRLSETMSEYWIQFAKSGDPNSRNVPHWPVYELGSNQVQELGREVHTTALSRVDNYQVFINILNKKMAERTRQNLETSGQIAH
jgi:para-nitrobenzyl esterase